MVRKMIDVIEKPDIISVNESVVCRVFRKRKELGYSGQDRRIIVNTGDWFFADYSGVFAYQDSFSMKSDMLTAECMTDGRKYKF